MHSQKRPLPVPQRTRPQQAPMPTTREEMHQRGWHSVDVVFVTGDAYVDHPSFAAGILTRALESAGFTVAVLPQPDWHTCEPWKTFGPPNLFFAVSAGNMDSMLNHYTANRKIRNDDAYSPGGQIGLRPDRATKAYCQRAREAYKNIPIIAGGVEASLRRLAHYDYWSDTVRRSIILDAKADLIVYGMGEKPIVEIATRLTQGQTIQDLHDMRGITYALGAKQQPPRGNNTITLPSFEEVRNDDSAFLRATRLIHGQANPYNGCSLVQFHDRQSVVCTPPASPLQQQELDALYDLPFTRAPHPRYTKPIPAFEMIKDSITIMRGCFGGCSFCSITLHQGRIVQSRSHDSVLKEISTLAKAPSFKGTISDIGGPTANMYEMHCTRPDILARCRRQSCVYPTICKLLHTDHDSLIALMRKTRKTPGVRKVLVASGVRTDLAQLSPKYVHELAKHHIGGLLKVAPEHCNLQTLRCMRKPPITGFNAFADSFAAISKALGKKQHLVPYFIASHPGCSTAAMIELACYLKKNNFRPDKVQDFIPAPMDLATCMYYTGTDPATGDSLPVARKPSERKVQRALMQFFKPENYFIVRQALIRAKRKDLIGTGPNALIPPQPPPGAIEARQNERPGRRGLPHERKTVSSGYRPGRKSAQRRNRRPNRRSQ